MTAGFDYTRHAQERLAQRFPEAMSQGVSPKVCIHRAFQGATLERGFLNDTRRIVWMLEKYGDFNYDYYLKGKMVFVTKNSVVITVIHRDDIGMQRMFGPSKPTRFRKKTPAHYLSS